MIEDDTTCPDCGQVHNLNETQIKFNKTIADAAVEAVGEDNLLVVTTIIMFKSLTDESEVNVQHSLFLSNKNSIASEVLEYALLEATSAAVLTHALRSSNPDQQEEPVQAHCLH